jgi:hypothetical protein
MIMTEESRKRKDANIKENCGSCVHKNVCGWKGKYENEVSALVHEMQTSTMIEYDMKCKHHMYDGSGVTRTLDIKAE